MRTKKAIGWNNKFYFAAVPGGGNGNSEESLWVSDGTVNGTIRLNDPVDYKEPKGLTVFKGALYFSSYSNSSYTNRLYKTDGTAAATGYVSLNDGTSSLSSYELATDGNTLFLSAYSTAYGMELFKYDGSNATCTVTDGITGDDSAYPKELYVHAGHLYFTAELLAGGRELYSMIAASTPTAIKSSGTNLFTLYPNPATSQVTVKSSEEIASLRLVGQLGNVLFETTENTLSLQSYSEGVYFVHVQMKNGETSFEKIILVK